MRLSVRLATALAVVAIVSAACVAEPGAPPDPAAVRLAAAAAPEATTLPATVCPDRSTLPVDPATGALVVSIDTLASLAGTAADCFGTTKLRVTGYVPMPVGLGGVTLYDFQPAWLWGPYDWATITSGRGQGHPSLTLRFPPSLGSCPATQYSETCVLFPYVHEWVTVVGHYDDPASLSCSATPIPGAIDAPPVTQAEATAGCRQQFVLDSFAPLTDTGPLPAVDPGLCPVAPITIDQLVAGTAEVGSQYGLGCLGSKEITLEAYVVPGVGLLSGMEQYTMAPRWLADPLNTGIVLAASAAAADAGGYFVGRVPPDMVAGFDDVACDGSAIDPVSCPFAGYEGWMVRVTGHYDDPESLTCTVVGGPGGSETAGTPLAPEAIVEGCREQFVVDTVEGIDGPVTAAEPSPAPTAAPDTGGTSGPSPTPPTTSTGG